MNPNHQIFVKASLSPEKVCAKLESFPFLHSCDVQIMEYQKKKKNNS